jgi:hypothetical protein
MNLVDIKMTEERKREFFEMSTVSISEELDEKGIKASKFDIFSDLINIIELQLYLEYQYLDI